MKKLNIGEEIYHARKRKGLSQKELSVKLNCSEKIISDWESNVQYPEFKYVIRLSKILHINVNKFTESKTINRAINASILICSIKNNDDLLSNSLPEDIEAKINQFIIPFTELTLQFDGTPVSSNFNYYMAFFSNPTHQINALKTAEEIYYKFNNECVLTLNCGTIYLANIGYEQYSNPTLIGKGVTDAILLNNWYSHNSNASIICSSNIYNNTKSKIALTPTHDHILENNVTIYINS